MVSVDRNSPNDNNGKEEPKTVVAVSKEDLDNRPDDKEGEDEQSWSFLLPVGVPVAITVLIIGAFFIFGRNKENSDLNLDISGATQSGQVAGFNSKPKSTGPKTPPKQSPSPSLEVSPSTSPSASPETLPTPSPSPTPETDASPSPSFSPEPTLSPSPSPSFSPEPTPSS